MENTIGNRLFSGFRKGRKAEVENNNKRKNRNTKRYTNKNVDLQSLSDDVELWFEQRNYITQSHKIEGKILIQATRHNFLRTISGSRRAFNIIIEGEPDNFTVDTGIGEWINNLAVVGIAALLTAGLLLFCVSFSTVWVKKIQKDISKFIDERVIFGKRAKEIKDKNYRPITKTEVKIEELKNKTDEKLSALKIAYKANALNENEYKKKKTEIEDKYHKDITIEEYKEAKEKGILTEEEYQKKVTFL